MTTEQRAKFTNPKQLVDEFKKSGEFDRLRRQLLGHFATSDDVRPLMSRIEEIVREKLSKDERLEHKTREAVHSEVMQDLERYPIIERAVNDVAIFKDTDFLKSIEQYARNIVGGKSNESTKVWEAKASTSNKQEDEDNESSDFTDDEEPDDDDLLIITKVNAETSAASQNPKLPNSTDGTSSNDRSSLLPGPQDERKPSTTHSSTPPPKDSLVGDPPVTVAPQSDVPDRKEHGISAKKMTAGAEEQSMPSNSENSMSPSTGTNTTHVKVLASTSTIRPEGSGTLPSPRLPPPSNSPSSHRSPHNLA